ncbi:1-aminocyclopropane-1-carboxylate oxidase-like isoform X1 [Tachypleus tridentatus]|uniref:1-aminocyclopropane-1-carboxylate oxidase-like isoform X1 n=1 Tax=Tachypleus tridentatus TaxID=6853 RepID=UPI003FD4AB47
MLYCPPLRDVKNPHVARFDEHTDFGTIRFLFQEDCGGMELNTKSGEWIQATPIKSGSCCRLAVRLDQSTISSNTFIQMSTMKSKMLLQRQMKPLVFHLKNTHRD